jgi:hypothetical protein
MEPQAAPPALHAAAQVTPPLDASQVTVAVRVALPPPASTVLGKTATATATGMIVIVALIEAEELQGFRLSVSQAGVAETVTGRPPAGIVDSAGAGAV